MAAVFNSPLRDLKNIVSSPAADAIGKSNLGGGNKENGTKKKQMLGKAATKPLVFDKAVYESPSGDQLKRINGENSKLRELNTKLINELRGARLSTKEAVDNAAVSAAGRASDGEQLQRVSEENAQLRSVNEKIIHHLRAAKESAQSMSQDMSQVCSTISASHFATHTSHTDTFNQNVCSYESRVRVSC